MNATNVICLAAYRALTGRQLQPVRLVQPIPAQVIRFEKVWLERHGR